MGYWRIEEVRKVALLRLDDPDDRMNKLKPEMMDEWRAVMDDLEANLEIVAVVLISGKQDSFIAGADIDMFSGFTKPGDAAKVGRAGQALLDRIAFFPKPFVAAIHGAALGGGLEVALACHARIASDDPKTVFGLPEVKLGLLPGLGGTQRLPRLIGLPTALDMLLTGKNVYAGKAKKIGLIDRLIHPPGLKEAAIGFARDLAKKNVSLARKRGFGAWLLAGNPFGRRLVFNAARKKVLKQTAGHYPAPLKILDCVKHGLSAGLAKGLAYEADQFDELVRSPESRALVRLFFAMNESRKNPDKRQARPVAKLAVIGAGLMGSGIAEVTIPKDYTVFLKDLEPKALARGEQAVWQSFQKKVAKRAMTGFERDRVLSRLHGVTDYAALRDADLVIEAVFEDLGLKHKILADIEEHCRETCIFASNTSSLPIAQIAAKAKRPEQVIGMHYFSPVAKMPLLEIIVTEKTAAWVRATAVEIGVAQGKNIIVVNDGPGFYTTRILGPMLNEAVVILGEGASVEEIDQAMIRFGFPVGPLTLLDEVGIDVGAHVGEVLKDLVAARGGAPSQAIAKLFEAGYLGRKNGKGFYRYDGKKKGPKRVNAEIYQFFGGPERKPFAHGEIQDRLALSMVNEAAFCLQENIIAKPVDGDLGAILGLGFPPFLGGPFRYLDTLGPKKVFDKLRGIEAGNGPRFKPAEILKGTKAFYPK